MKLLLLVLALAAAGCAKEPWECLVIDNIHPISEKEYIVVGHNRCAERIGNDKAILAAIRVDLKFYNAAGERIGNDELTMTTLDPGERFRHRYPIFSAIREQGKVVSIKVDRIQ